ncbi:MAG: hypothetical protein ABFD50_13190, partial [Smithella sp.]
MRWTTSEINFIQQHYPRGTEYCSTMLKRTRQSIQSKMKRLRKKSPDEVFVYSCYWAKIAEGAKRRGLQVLVEKEYILDLYKKQGGRCALTGVKLKLAQNSKEWKSRVQTASLDRIDPSKGYIEGNLQWT